MNYFRMDILKSHKRDSFYGSLRWQKLRSACGKRDEYVCQMCFNPARGRAKGVADHKLPRKTHPHLEWELSNLWWLCTHCHNSIKQSHERNPDREQIGVDGLKTEWAK